MPLVMKTDSRKRMTSLAAGSRHPTGGRPGLLLRAVLAAVLASVIGPVSGAAAEPPSLTITWPINGRVTNNQTPAFSGTTSQPYNEFTDNLEPVTLTIYDMGGKQVQTPTSGSFTGRTWSLVPTQPLAPGAYTAQAQQRDEAGNAGASQPVTFTVTRPPELSPSPPVASFRWFPAAPRVGETVSLVSTSTDIASSITQFAWALGSNAPFKAGE